MKFYIQNLGGSRWVPSIREGSSCLAFCASIIQKFAQKLINIMTKGGRREVDQLFVEESSCGWEGLTEVLYNLTGPKNSLQLCIY
jgi:hypothetical protein